MLEPVRRFMQMIEGALRPPPEFARAGIDEETYSRMRERALAAYRDPPRIALIGETGVGKSSTINGLFNSGCEVSHRLACTQHEQELTVKEGKLRVFDMPGLGEDIDRDAEHMETYRRVLPECDVALWIVKADSRAITNVQQALKDLVDHGTLDPRRLVIGINQIDLLQPGTWSRRYNVPGKEQRETIRARTEDVREKIGRIVQIPAVRVVPYSAMKQYHLRELLEGIEAACDRSRSWVIQDIASCANFQDLAEVGDV